MRDLSGATGDVNAALDEARAARADIEAQMAAANPEEAEGWHRLLWYRCGAAGASACAWARAGQRRAALQHAGPPLARPVHAAALLPRRAGRRCLLTRTAKRALLAPLMPPPPPRPPVLRYPYCHCSQQYPLVEERLREVAGRVAPVNEGVQALGDLASFVRTDQVQRLLSSALFLPACLPACLLGRRW